LVGAEMGINQDLSDFYKG